MKKILLTLTLLAVVLSGCRKDQRLDQTKGEMSITLSSEGEFTPVTKVDASDAVDLNDFAVAITNKTTGAKVLSWNKLSEVPAVIAIDPASYTIKATSPGIKDVAWNQPVYEGTQDFVIEGGKVVNIDLTCTLRNMKVTVRCSERFTNELNDDFTIKVSTADGYLEFTKAIIDQGTSMAGFFSVAPISVDIKGTRRLDGSVVSHYFTITNVAARDHHVITVDAKETGEINVGPDGISVSYEVNNRPTDIIIDSLVENPVEDDLSGEPVFQRASIASGATAVDTTIGAVTLTYSLPIALASTPNITLGSVPVTTSVEGKTLTVSFGKLAAATAYTLTVPAGAVVNATDQTAAAAQTISFTTVEKAAAVPITISATAGITTPATFTEGTAVGAFNIDISAPNGIKSLPIEVLSQALVNMVLELDNGCDGTFDMAAMSASEAEFWGGLFKKTSSEVKNATTLQFSIGSFIPMMPKGTHSIKLTVIDNNDNQVSSTVTFIIQ